MYRNTIKEESFTGRNLDSQSTNKRIKKSSSVMKFTKQKKPGNYSYRKMSVGPIVTSKLNHLPKEVIDSRTFKNCENQQNVSFRLQNAIMPQSSFSLISNSRTSK